MSEAKSTGGRGMSEKKAVDGWQLDRMLRRPRGYERLVLARLRSMTEQRARLDEAIEASETEASAEMAKNDARDEEIRGAYFAKEEGAA